MIKAPGQHRGKLDLTIFKDANERRERFGNWNGRFINYKTRKIKGFENLVNLVNCFPALYISITSKPYALYKKVHEDHEVLQVNEIDGKFPMNCW